jgi:hypothetical protein
MKIENGKRPAQSRALVEPKEAAPAALTAVLSNVLYTAAASALARRKQVTSLLTRHTIGLRWKLPK